MRVVQKLDQISIIGEYEFLVQMLLHKTCNYFPFINLFDLEQI